MLVPVDAVTDIGDVVHIGQERIHVAGGPVYDPDLVLQPDDLAGLYDHYGMLPYWNAGYRGPRFPLR